MSHLRRPEGFPRSSRRKVGFPATALGTKANSPRPLARYKHDDDGEGDGEGDGDDEGDGQQTAGGGDDEAEEEEDVQQVGCDVLRGVPSRRRRGRLRRRRSALV